MSIGKVTLFVQLICLLAIFGCAKGFDSLPTSSPERETALKLLREDAPEVSWKHSELKQADINCDSLDDYLFGIEDDSTYSLGIVFAPVHPKSTTAIAFFKTQKKSPGSFCGKNISLMIDDLDLDPHYFTKRSLPGHHASESCKGVLLVESICSSIHVYWDQENKRLRWWRP